MGLFVEAVGSVRMWPLKTILYFILFWWGCLYAVINPIWGVVNYMMAYQTNPTNTWWGEPLESMGMRFSLLAAVFTILGLVFGRRFVPKVKPLFTSWEVGIFALLAIAGVNVFIGATYDHRSVMALNKLWKMMLFVLIIARLGSDRRNLTLILWALVAGSLYVGHDAYTAGSSAFLDGRLNRIGGPDFSTSSGTAAHLSAMLPLIGAVFLITPNWWAKAFAAVSAAFSFNCIILCRTRSAFIGLVVGAAVALLMAPKARRYRIHALLIGGAVSAFALTDDYFWSRMNTLFDEQALSTDLAAISRTEIWKTSLDILADHPLGIGAGNFARVITTYEPRYAKRSTHNTILVCFVELGIQGGIVMLGIIILSLSYIQRSYRMASLTSDPARTTLLAYGLLISFVTYLVSGLGTERFYCESYWWVMALPVCLHRVVLQEVAEHSCESEVEIETDYDFDAPPFVNIAQGAQA